MALTWRDGLDTLLGAGVIGAIWANQHYESSAFWGSNRWMMGVVALLGLVMGALAADLSGQQENAPYRVFMDVLAIGTAATLALGLIFGTTAYLVITASLVGAMWLTGILRHAFMHSHKPAHTL